MTRTVARHRDSQLNAEQLEQRFDEVGKQTDVLEKFIKKNLKQDIDYGAATEQANAKPTLLKPGAEKICLLLNLRPTFEKDLSTLSELSTAVREETVAFVCFLMDRKKDAIMGEGRGASSIWKMSKGTKILDVNRAIKMAEKRAQMDAVLRVASLSGRFTQDMEDEEYRNDRALPPPPSVRPAAPPRDAPRDTGVAPTKPQLALLERKWKDFMRVKNVTDPTSVESNLNFVLERNFKIQGRAQMTKNIASQLIDLIPKLQADFLQTARKEGAIDVPASKPSTPLASDGEIAGMAESMRAQPTLEELEATWKRINAQPMTIHQRRDMSEIFMSLRSSFTPKKK